MQVVRTAVVALSLLLLGTPTIQAEPGREDPPASQTAAPAPQPTLSPTAAPTTVKEMSADDLRRAIELAAGFLGPHQLRGVEAWIVTQGASLLGPGFNAWARTLSVPPAVVNAAKQSPLKTFPMLLPTEGRLWSLRAMPQRKIAALPKPNAVPVAGVEPRRFDEQGTGDLILMTVMSVACHDLSRELRTKWLGGLSSTDKHSYVLATQLFSVMIGYNQGCLSLGVANPIRRQLATSVFEEVRADIDTLDDLSIYRIAALCYAGACEWIDPELIARLVAEQQPSGSWGLRDPQISGLSFARPDHTAAYAFYALARAWSLHHASGHAGGPKPPSTK